MNGPTDHREIAAGDLPEQIKAKVIPDITDDMLADTFGPNWGPIVDYLRRAASAGPLDWAHDTTYTDRREATLVASDVEWSLLLAVLERHETQAVNDLGADLRAQLRRQWGGPKP